MRRQCWGSSRPSEPCEAAGVQQGGVWGKAAAPAMPTSPASLSLSGESLRLLLGPEHFWYPEIVAQNRPKPEVPRFTRLRPATA